MKAAPKLFLVGVASFFIFGCGASSPPTSESNSAVAETVVPANVDELASPTALLRELKRVVDSRDEAGLRSLIRTIPMGGSETNADHAVTRIFGGVSDGNFGYTACAITTLIARGDEPFRTPSGSALELMEELRQVDAELDRLWEESPDSFQALWNTQGFLLLVRERGSFKILFWEDLETLSDCEAEAGLADSIGSNVPPEAEAGLRAAFTALSEYTAAHGLPPAVPFTPNAILDGVCPAPQWEPGHFAAMDFTPDDPVHFAYALNIDPQNDWELLALGYPECSGQRVRVRMTGGVDDGGLYRNPGLEILPE